MPANHFLELLEQVLLGVYPLDDSFDHQLAIGQRIQCFSLQQSRAHSIGLGLSKPLLFHATPPQLDDKCLGFIDRAFAGVMQFDAQARFGCDLRDATPHGTAADDT